MAVHHKNMQSDARIIKPVANSFNQPTEQSKKSLKYARDKDREIVRGKFRFHEIPGGVMEFVFRKYKQDPVESFTMVDGEIYQIPRGVANHLNKNCWYPIHHFLRDENGHMTAAVNRKVQRCSFESLEFMDDDDGRVVDIVDVKPMGSLDDIAKSMK